MRHSGTAADCPTGGQRWNISTASLILGVASARLLETTSYLPASQVLLAGAMSMASEEDVSVSSQSDTKNADLVRDRHELAVQPEFEKEELAQILRTISKSVLAGWTEGKKVGIIVGTVELARLK